MNSLAALLFVGCLAWSVNELFLPHQPVSVPAPRRQGLLPEDGPDWQELLRLVRETQPAPPQPRAWRPRQLVNTWRWIVIHHSATIGGNAKSIDRYHRDTRHMENGLAYHFLIGNGRGSGDGEVEVGGRWRRQIQGGHLSERTSRGKQLNREAIGICLVGDFTRYAPTEKQIASLKGLINYLTDITRVNEKHIRTHLSMPEQSTECPGIYLPLDKIIRHRRRKNRE